VALQAEPQNWGAAPEASAINAAPLPVPIPQQIIQGFTRMRLGQAVRIFTQSMDINARMVTELRLRIDRPDVIIRPDVMEFGLFELLSPEHLIQRGFEAAQAKLGEVHKATSWRGKVNRFFRTIAPIDEPMLLYDEPTPTHAK